MVAVASLLVVVAAALTADGLARGRVERALAEHLRTEHGAQGVRVRVDQVGIAPVLAARGSLARVEVHADALFGAHAPRLRDVDVVAEGVGVRRPYPLSRLRYSALLADDDLGRVLSERSGLAVTARSTDGTTHLLVDGADAAEMEPGTCPGGAPCLVTESLPGAPGGADLAAAVPVLRLQVLPPELLLTGVDELDVVEGGVVLRADEQVPVDGRIFVEEPEAW